MESVEPESMTKDLVGAVETAGFRQRGEDLIDAAFAVVGRRPDDMASTGDLRVHVVRFSNHALWSPAGLLLDPSSERRHCEGAKFVVDSFRVEHGSER